MSTLVPESVVEALLDDLASDGHLVRGGDGSDGVRRWHFAAQPLPQGYLHRDGNRYWVVDLSRMPPLYQELYDRVYATRLELWGASTGSIVGRAGGILLFGGPDEAMRAQSPRIIAGERIRAGDHAWVEEVDLRWRTAAMLLEEKADQFWRGLCAGASSAETLRELLDRKIHLNAIGMDSLMPPPDQVQQWLERHLEPTAAAEVRTGCYLPVSGHVAYDALELECWELARASRQQPGIPLAARARFVIRGLFYNYEALDTDRKAYFFGTDPCEVARTYVRAAPGSAQLAARLAEVPDRAWRRRYHRQWARIQIEDCVRQEADRHRLLLWHRLIGAAREFDEEKRRLNMPLWRSLFALADGLGVSLLSPGGIDELCSAVERQQGGIVVDSVFRFGTDSRGND